MDNIKFITPGKPEYLTMVRLAIASIANTAGFDYDAIEDIKTAVEEGCKNVSCHGIPLLFCFTLFYHEIGRKYR